MIYMYMIQKGFLYKVLLRENFPFYLPAITGKEIKKSPQRLKRPENERVVNGARTHDPQNHNLML